MTEFRSVAKAIAGASAGAIGSMGTTFIVVPPEVVMPWWAYIVTGALNAAIGFGVVYFAPSNRDKAPVE